MRFSSQITQLNYRIRNVTMLHIKMCAILHLLLDTTSPGDNNFDFMISYFFKESTSTKHVLHNEQVFKGENYLYQVFISFVVLFRLQLFRTAIARVIPQS